MDDNDNRVQFRVDDETRRALERLTSPGETLGLVARRMVDSYLQIVMSEMPSLGLSEAEAWLIVDALNSVYIEPQMIRLLRATILDAIEVDHLDEKWGVERGPFLEKLRSYRISQLFAIWHATQCYWTQCHTLPGSEGLRKAGLVHDAANEQDS